MTNVSQGVFITDQLFLPRYMWFKMKLDLPMAKQKSQFFIDIQIALKELQILYNNSQTSFKNLENLIRHFNDIRNKIGKEIGAPQVVSGGLS